MRTVGPGTGPLRGVRMEGGCVPGGAEPADVVSSWQIILSLLSERVLRFYFGSFERVRCLLEQGSVRN